MPMNFNEYDNDFKNVSERVRSLKMSKEELDEWREWAEEWREEKENCTNTEED